MNTIFINSANRKTSDHHRLLLNHSDKRNLKRSDKYVALSNLSIYYTGKKYKNVIKNSKSEISAPTWNGKFELPDALYSISGIQHYFEYIINKFEQLTDNPPIRKYVHKIENRI